MTMSHVTTVPSTLPGDGYRAEGPRAGRPD
ncbi:hypothetical protein IW248_005481 [Micromonospora ureilytica]|uniref:Uncharacterized protein n=1 Tax=Micromonospora ureilytica TaxID=709868 RepID=A0ABS0JQ79_9ACTN|nr:hypothetical protein [Micromonospora ureilytica]